MKRLRTALLSGRQAAGARTAARSAASLPLPLSSSVRVRASASCHSLTAVPRLRFLRKKASLSQFGAALGVFGAGGEESR